MGTAKATYSDELEFEHDLVHLLVHDMGWKDGVISNPSENDLIENWARILYQNNDTPDRLNGAPLTRGEIGQLYDQVRSCRTPLEANALINGVSLSVKRDNPDDPEHLGKEISLEVYDRAQIGGGKTVYQIAEQPHFEASNEILPKRRGDVMLLINGLPVIHIELKRSGVAVTQAVRQIEKYKHEQVFTGMFGLVQVFVALNPEKSLYFANVERAEDFNERFMFHWADKENRRVDRWQGVAKELLSIPMAHQLVGYYTVADGGDNVLKVMRSYQYYAASLIKYKLAHEFDWSKRFPKGGYVWHTTGSGKTLTSFKAAQLIASNKLADKVIFLVDRIELGTQSLKEYRGFASERETVNATENTDVLEAMLSDWSYSKTLIVTSIQKLALLCKERADSPAIAKAKTKRIAIIVDECHRNVFGEMMLNIRDVLDHAVFFGFTGTPILAENARSGSFTTESVFGGPICRYTIANGIKDGNVLGFDIEYWSVFNEDELRECVALDKAKAATVDEALSDPKKLKTFLFYTQQVGMAERWWDPVAERQRTGIEGLVPRGQYDSDGYRREVVGDIRKRWKTLSIGGRYHAIFATSSIPEAIAYWRLFHEMVPELAVTALFDPNIDNKEGFQVKEEGLVDILRDYNARYGKSYDLASYALSDPKADSFKRDVAARLAHKEAYRFADRHPEQVLDLLIVVDQMLTGFDSKWVNTLYVDKILDYERVIQAFSRTNRVHGPAKAFGSIRCYRAPNTMKANVNAALRLYSDGERLQLFVPKLHENLTKINEITNSILELFETDMGLDLSRLPEADGSRSMFALRWRDLNERVAAARIQGFTFEESRYPFVGDGDAWTLAEQGEAPDEVVEVKLNERIWEVLALRYNELFEGRDKEGRERDAEVPYDISPDLMRIEKTKVDAEYIEEKFGRFVETLDDTDDEKRDRVLSELHNQFALLSREDQAYAEVVIQKLQCGEIKPEEGMEFVDYINSEKQGVEDRQLARLCELLGCDENAVRELMAAHPDNASINLHGRYDAILEGLDVPAVKQRLSETLSRKVRGKEVMVIADSLLRRFVLEGPYDMEESLETLR